MDNTAYTLFANDKPIEGKVSVLYIQVAHEANRIPYVQMIIEDGDAVKGDFPVSSQFKDLHPGNVLTVFMGAGDKKQKIFSGVIIKQIVKLGPTGKSRLEIEARHMAYRMSLGRKSRQFQPPKEPQRTTAANPNAKTIRDHEVIKIILQEYGLAVGDFATNIAHQELIQFQSTDWDFVISRAEANGMICLAGIDNMTFVNPNASNPAVLTLQLGKNIKEMEAELDVRWQAGAVKAFSWQPSNLEVIEVSETDETFPEAGAISTAKFAKHTNQWEELLLPHGGARLQSELTEWAQNRHLRNKLAKIRGTVSTLGNAKVKAGDWVDFQGGGDLFNGKLLAGGVRHVYAEGIWTTDIQLGLSPQPHAEAFSVNDVPAGGLAPAVSGIQIGIVSNIHEDPTKQNNIQVRLPVQSQAGLEVKVWARLSSFDAGNDRGALFRPEVGDEVVLGFVNADPRDAILLGMLHSNAHPAPFEAATSAANNFKGIRTKNGLELLFDDEAQAITLQTPNGNALTIHETDNSITLKDSHNNKLTLNEAGITLDSGQDILLKAAGDVIIEGINVEATASAAITAKGNASAELSASGTTTVKGSLVQIN